LVGIHLARGPSAIRGTRRRWPSSLFPSRWSEDAMRGWLSRFMATHGAIAAAVALMTLGAGGATAVARVNGRIERIEREHESIRARMLLLETATDTIRSTTQATRALADRIL